MTIGELKAEELDAALKLVWNVLLQHEAPEYSAKRRRAYRPVFCGRKSGKESARRFLNGPAIYADGLQYEATLKGNLL